MPIIDATQHACYFCGTRTNVLLCENCHKYSCRECKQATDESGCYHKPKNIVTSQEWQDNRDFVLGKDVTERAKPKRTRYCVICDMPLVEGRFGITPDGNACPECAENYKKMNGYL